MTDHSKLPPSSAARRMACPGSRALEEKYPEDQDSPHAVEGKAAHKVCFDLLTATLECVDINKSTYLQNNISINEEMWDGARIYVDHILGVYEFTDVYAIEERLDISTIHTDCWGTPDFWLAKGRTELHLWDYKYGHKYVEVFENWQLIEYAAGILDYLGITGLEDQHLKIHFHVVQPRSYHRLGHIRSWEIKAVELRSYFNILRGAEAEAAQDYAICNPSPECTYCTGRHACSAIQQASMDAADMSELNAPLELSPAATGTELRVLKAASVLLEARITGLEEQAKAMIKRGDRVPHFKLEKSVGRARWTKEAPEIIAMGKLFGYKLSKQVEAITPTQAIKLGMVEELLGGYIEKSRGELKLVADTESEARKIFGGGQ